MSSANQHQLVLDPFGKRQFNNPDYTGTQIIYSEIEFEKRVNEEFIATGSKLIDGYAPFCKHIFVPNFMNVKCGYAKITPENSHLIESCYEARKESELPVLIQYFDRNKVEAPLASHLDIILYSREQINLENIAMNEVPPQTEAPWGIISVKGQLCTYGKKRLQLDRSLNCECYLTASYYQTNCLKLITISSFFTR